MTSSQAVIRVRAATALLGAGLLAISFSATGAAAGQPVEPTAGTEELCPATEGLSQNESMQHEASAIRSHLGCKVSEDPGPADPG
jgi:hypothetical protein